MEHMLGCIACPLDDLVPPVLLSRAQQCASLLLTYRGKDKTQNEYGATVKQIQQAKKRAREDGSVPVPDALQALRAEHGPSKGSMLHREYIRKPYATLKRAADVVVAAVEKRILQNSEKYLRCPPKQFDVHVDFEPTSSFLATIVYVKDAAHFLNAEEQRATLEKRVLCFSAEGQTLRGTLKFWKDVSYKAGSEHDNFYQAYSPLGFSQEEGEDVTLSAEVPTTVVRDGGMDWEQSKGNTTVRSKPRKSLEGVIAVVYLLPTGVAYVVHTPYEGPALAPVTMEEKKPEVPDQTTAAPPKPTEPTCEMRLDNDDSFTRILLGLS
ncbi:hypothetical protein ADEAN_000083500 [Angomonas deanei]|uniref:Uncharacterized protein n=1 Tax=Angomonas deanei TaxID=59799 RepID=A0A7G2C2B6_9TRYP|nr:hypothetical protein ADEAN_000083500 [Angomonas deanei]